MAQIYATVEETLGYFPLLTEPVQNQSKIEGILKQFLYDASRMFETETRADVDFYAPSTSDFADKVYRFKGTSKIHVYPFREFQSIRTSDDTELEDAEVYDPRTILLYRRGCGQFLRYDDPLTVNAKWGYGCTPENVRMATKIGAVLLFRNAPSTRLNADLEYDDEFIGQLIRTYRDIVDGYLRRNAYLTLPNVNI